MALAGPELLEECRLQTGAKEFVETGTHRGDGVAIALEAGFEKVYSVEVNEFSYGWSCHRFRNDRERVGLHLGDSVLFLRNLLLVPPLLGGPSVFWLDAHWNGGEGELEGRDQRRDPPLLKELEIIAAHGNPRHAVLIDDARNFGVELPDKEAVEEAVMRINPAFEIEYRDGAEFENDILVAMLPRSE